MPLGCQTVFVSKNATIPANPGSADQSGTDGRRIRFKFSAAEISSSKQRAP